MLASWQVVLAKALPILLAALLASGGVAGAEPLGGGDGEAPCEPGLPCVDEPYAWLLRQVWGVIELLIGIVGG